MYYVDYLRFFLLGLAICANLCIRQYAQGSDGFLNDGNSGVESAYNAAIEKLADGNITKEAIDDLLQLSRIVQRDSETLDIVNNLIREYGNYGSTSEVTHEYCRLSLAKARILVRLDQYDMAKEIFLEGARDLWVINPFWEWNAALHESGDLVMLAKEEFKRNLVYEFSDETREFYGLNPSLTVFFIRLNECLSIDGIDLIQEVFFPLYLDYKDELLESDLDLLLCLCTYMRGEASASKAIDLINDILSRVPAPTTQYEEELWRFLPLLASIMNYGNGDAEGGERRLLAYYERNSDIPVVMLSRALEIMYSLEKNPNNAVLVRSFCSGLMANFNFSQLVESHVNDELMEKYASLADTYASALYMTGATNRAKSVWESVYNDYAGYNSWAAFNALLNLARIEYLHERDALKAKELLEIIIEECEIQLLIDRANIMLAEIGG